MDMNKQKTIFSGGEGTDEAALTRGILVSMITRDDEEQAVEDRGKILAALKQKMVQSVKNETLFTIKWKVI